MKFVKFLCGSNLEKIVVTGYKALQLMYFFTSGEDEVKAWTIQKNTKAPQAAGKIHTDFEKGFIMADIMKFDDFKEAGSENGVKVRNDPEATLRWIIVSCPPGGQKVGRLVRIFLFPNLILLLTRVYRGKK